MTNPEEAIGCPFCGAKPYIEWKGADAGGWQIVCFCEFSPSMLDQSREYLIKRWNRRLPCI
jgi:hypothetical protein